MRPNDCRVTALRCAGLCVLAATAGLLACRPARGGSARTATLTISHAVVPVPASASEATAFMVLKNIGPSVARFASGFSPDADSVVVHRDIGGQMQPVAALEVPAGGSQRFAPGSLHLMLSGLRRILGPTDTVTLVLHFVPGGDITVRAPVLRYTEAISEVP